MEPFDLVGGINEASDNPQRSAKMALRMEMPTYRDRLEQSLVETERRAADMRRAKEILEAHPELEELLSIVQRTRF